MNCLSMLCFTIGILLSAAGILDFMQLVIVVVGGFTARLLSSGRSVEVKSNYLILSYGFPKPVVRYVVRNVTDVFDANEISRGRLVKYFKYHLFVFTLIMFLPVMYVIVKGLYPSLAYIPFLLAPVLIGVVLELYIAFTAESYRRLIRRLMIVLSMVLALACFIAGVSYEEYYGATLFHDVNAMVYYLLGVVLLATAAITFLALWSRYHVVVIESCDGAFYAIGAATANDAKELIKLVLREVMSRVETTA